MASYKIEISATAEKQLGKLSRADQIRVLRSILTLGLNPRPRGCRKLKGYDDIYRIRVGIFRVIYSIEEKKVLVIILKIGQRKDIYR